MQDFLLTPLLREAVTYKLAHQIHNLRPEKDYALGPLDMFPAGIADAADWRNLIFEGWWSWLEKWGKFVSIFLSGILPLRGRQMATHDSVLTSRPLSGTRFQPQPAVGIGTWTGCVPYAVLPCRWRRFKQHFTPEGPHCCRTPLPPPRDYEPLRPRVPLQHDYLTVHEEKPPLPRSQHVSALTII